MSEDAEDARPTAAWVFGAGLGPTLDAVAAARGAPHRGVAGALLLEQYAARLVRPVLTGWATGTAVGDCAPDRVRVDLHAGRVRGVELPDDGSGGPDDVPTRLFTGLGSAVAAVHATARTGTRVLRGSVAHAVAVTFLALAWPDDDPDDHLTRARELLARHGLADLVTLEARPVDGRPWLYAERRTCCLAFRSTVRSHDGYCATCPVTPAPERHASFVDAVRAYVARRPG